MSFASVRETPESSASSIVADNAAGYHDLKIDGCLLTAGVPAETLITSLPFTVGGHRWRIRYYPNGDKAESKGYVSLYLVLDEDVAGPVTAQLQFSAVVEKRGLFLHKKKEEEKKRLSTRTDAKSFGSHGCWGWTQFETRETLRGLVRPRDGGDLTIPCDVVVFNEFRVEPAADPVADLIPVPPPELHKHLGDLLQSGRGADVVFEAGGEMFPVHRCVLAARSPVISAELLGGGTTSSEGVEDVEAPVFRALLRFAYTDALPEDMDKEVEEDGLIYGKPFLAAERYGLLRLQLICTKKLCHLVDAETVKTFLACRAARK